MSTLGQIQKFQLHQDLKDEIDNKVIKETGKVLSTNDFTDAYKDKLDKVSSIDDLDEDDIDKLIEKLNNAGGIGGGEGTGTEPSPEYSHIQELTEEEIDIIINGLN